VRYREGSEWRHSLRGGRHDTAQAEDWGTGTLKQEAKHLFKGHVGGGATGSGTDKMDPGYNPWKKETWNLTEQSKVFRADPDRARTLARRAGATLPTTAA
jgi:hypothetical protein